jgi:3-dehydroquinate synthase
LNKISRHTAVTVPLGTRSYPIYIGNRLLHHAGAYFRNHRITGTVVIITDSTVAKLYRTTVERALSSAGCTVRTIVIPPGELQKSLERAEKIYTQMLRWNIDRSATIVALGGGVIGDLAGFIAATFLRGLRFVQIPTTVLAQVDSSVGGKVGVNHALGKNMIGAFHQPAFVLADTGVLKSLPRREIVCGLGEVIKYGVILDKSFFRFSKKHLQDILRCDQRILHDVVKQSCLLKAFIVSKDEREEHLRAILNFGHTIGHALEKSGQFSVLKHGEAVLYGMLAETHIAAGRSIISRRDADEIRTTIMSVPLPALSKIPMNFAGLFSAMQKDKKSKAGQVHAVLPTMIGTVTHPVPISLNELRDAVTYLKTHAK